jgi:hypothetical protein
MLARLMELIVAMSRVGRIQRQVRRRLVAADGPVQFSELVAWSYAGDRRPWRWPIYRALRRWGVNVGRGWWAPNDELRRLIEG